MNTITVTVDGEPVMLCFKSMKAALKVVKEIQDKFPVQAETEQVETEQHAKNAAAYIVSQPVFVDIQSNQTDARVVAPGGKQMRTVTSTGDHLESLQPKKVQGIVQQQVAPTQQPTTALSEKIFKVVYQILVHMFSKEPGLLLQASYQTGIKLDKGDPTQLQTLVKGMTQRLLKFPLADMVLKLTEIQQIPPPLLERLRELQREQEGLTGRPSENPPVYQKMSMMVPNIAPPVLSMPPPITRSQIGQVQSNPIQNRIVDPAISLTNYKRYLENMGPAKITQAQSVMTQLEPFKISQLLHSTYVTFLAKYSFAVIEQNKVVKEGENSLQQSLYAWSANVTKQKKVPKNETDLSSKIIRLYERQAVIHKRLVDTHELAKYHKKYAEHENLLILILGSLAKIGPKMTEAAQTVEKITQVAVFEDLSRLVEKHRQGSSNKPQAKMPEPARHMKGPGLVAIKQEDDERVIEKAEKPQAQEDSEATDKTGTKPEPQQAPPQPQQPQPPPPAPQQQPEADTTGQQQQQTSKMSKMSPEFQRQIREIFKRLVNQVEPLLVMRVIALILGLGTTLGLDVTRTRTYFECELTNIVKNSRFDIPQERLFIMVSELIPLTLEALKNRAIGEKPAMFGKGIKPFETFFEEYLREVKRVSAKDGLEEAVKSSEYLLIYAAEVQEILGSVAEKQVQPVQQKIGVQQHVMQKRSAFGIDRSDTDDTNE